MKLFSVVIIILCKLIILSKCEWVEITQYSTKNPLQVSEVLRPTTARTLTNSNFRTDHETRMSKPSPYQITTFIPDLNSNSSEDEHKQATLETTRAVTGEQTTESELSNDPVEEKEEEGEDCEDDEAEPRDDSSNFPNNTSSGYNGFVSFMTTIQNSLVANTKKTVKSKLNLLKNLRDNLLYEIQERMSRLWKPRVTREARGHYEDDDHHMDFPSNEGALMTISFLTFAVYLIKLVMKLIHALKNKSQIVTTTISPTATGIIIGRRKREATQDEAIRILQLIEEYSLM